MVLARDKLVRKYSGKNALRYDKKRGEQRKWHRENELVKAMTSGVPSGSKVLDLPCGTGRLFGLWRERGYDVIGVDISQDMLTLAKKRVKVAMKIKLEQYEVLTAQELQESRFDMVACVRLLHLIAESQVALYMAKLTSLLKTGGLMVLTIQLGGKYRPGSDVATHAEDKFLRLLKKLRLKIEKSEKITAAGWRVMSLRKEGATSKS
jgi:ubiquinone/menaquinone biosynthesis C-methylase UbiE